MRVRKAKQYKKHPEHVKRYLQFVREMAERAEGTLTALARQGIPESRMQETRELTELVWKLEEQVDRRIL